MTGAFFLMRLEAALVRVMLRVLMWLGPVRASDFMGAVCRLVGPLVPVSRIADINLRLVFPRLTRGQRRRLIQAVWENIGRTAGEFPHIGTLVQNPHSGPGWDIVGGEHLLKLAQGNKPVILVSAHIGNWEMLPLAAARYGLPFGSLYRAPNNPLVNRIIRDIRVRNLGFPAPFFAKGSQGAREALKYLSTGGNLGFLIDQKMNDGVKTRFLGHSAMTAPAAATLAIRLGCPVVTGYVERLGPARLRVHVDPPLDFTPTHDKEADILALTQTLNDRIGEWIRQNPHSWLWLHKRWPKNIYLRNNFSVF